MTVPGYLINSKVPGLALQMRSYFSAPMIDFSYIQSSSPLKLDFQPETDKEETVRHVLTDITNIEDLKIQRGETNENLEEFIQNPFNNKGETEFLKVTNVNSRAGETVVSSRIIREIDRQYE